MWFPKQIYQTWSILKSNFYPCLHYIPEYVEKMDFCQHDRWEMVFQCICISLIMSYIEHSFIWGWFAFLLIPLVHFFIVLLALVFLPSPSSFFSLSPCLPFVLLLLLLLSLPTSSLLVFPSFFIWDIGLPFVS